MNMMHPQNDANDSELIASSPDVSKSSNTINKIADDNISNAINNEVDKILGSNLERTNSGCDLKVIAPLRHKKREYRSQEALPLEESLNAGSSYNINILPSQSEVQINDLHNTKKLKVPRASILHDNQRAEIIASVTERLYSKLKRKEEVAVAKMESMVDKKIVEPLSELKICSNARQRLIELSQKAIRNRRKVNVPAHTQTRSTVTRVKDQGVDVQSDLETYSIKKDIYYIKKRDASTETPPITPRYKEIGVGPKYGSLNSIDRSTITDVKQCYYTNSFMMTENMIKNDCFTQTQVIPPPRRRKRGSKKAFGKYDKNNGEDVFSYGPAISINISQTYPIDSESQSSEDNLICMSNKKNTDNDKMTPDLLTNHTPDINDNDIGHISDNNSNQVKKLKDNEATVNLGLKQDHDDFSDNEDYSLPRVIPDSSRKSTRSDIKEMILGRNKNMYPYNIILSPPKRRGHSKRIVSFKDFDYGNEVVEQSSYNDENNINVDETPSFTSEEIIPEKRFLDTIYASKNFSMHDSSVSDKAETDFYIWNKELSENKPLGSLRRKHLPVYRSHARQSTAKEQHKDIMSSDSTDKSYGPQYISKYRPRNQFLERTRNDYVDNEFESIQRKIFDACNELELSVNRYNNYIKTSINHFNGDKNNILLKTPTKYLQHLIRLRREMVKIEQVSNNAVFEDSPN